MKGHTTPSVDPFLLKYSPSELGIAAEFLTTWLPFLTKGLCRYCQKTISNRVASLDPGGGQPDNSEQSQSGEGFSCSNQTHPDGCDESHCSDSDANSLGSWKESANGNAQTTFAGVAPTGWSDDVPDAPTFDGQTSKPATYNLPASGSSDDSPVVSTVGRQISKASSYNLPANERSGNARVASTVGKPTSRPTSSNLPANEWSDDARVAPIVGRRNSKPASSNSPAANEWSDNARVAPTVGRRTSYASPVNSWLDDTPDASTVDRRTSKPASYNLPVNGWSDEVADVSTFGGAIPRASTYTFGRSWADMTQEDDELYVEEEEDREVAKEAPTSIGKVVKKPELSREKREYIRFNNVERKKDFICLNKIDGKIVNVLKGLELHKGVFSAAEQKRIVDFVYDLQEKGRKGELRARTYTAPEKWMRGKGRVTIQFGCCYNYSTDKAGNPPGILRNEQVDPIPSLFKVIIKRLVRWHVLPPSCVPDSCIVNIYDEEDCIPPHIDNHDFVRPFCTVSFLSECNIVFGRNLSIIGPGEFAGETTIPLPVGSVLVLNGNGADVAKHCVPAVPTKRISITFRKMDEAKIPIGFVPEHDLQGLEPLPYVVVDEPVSETDAEEPMSAPPPSRPLLMKEVDLETKRGFLGRGSRSEPRQFGRIRSRPSHRPRPRVNLDN